ncbi:2-methoxy-6-polyprenyl-1,4-benzoquinol methylase, mitochondrial [Dendrobium catenatum]|uniref:2-methoxy-6-polyprenyl-1,4-benzoquinol methylase, mitochondrial n=1 Tax=Dendrobium catenatum TaxID=906689 RepID=A0A2I0WQX3_9ASPA|nr:2-methoxy-6-polyprenyl-1,4-benzoquinol methylase, mitochondrial [Dendrobium catenatum]
MALKYGAARLASNLRHHYARSASLLHSHATSFGFKEVSEEEKSKLVGNVFNSVASNYDLMNDLMSGGLHRLWKDRLVSKLHPFPGMKHLDVAGGTDDQIIKKSTRFRYLGFVVQNDGDTISKIQGIEARRQVSLPRTQSCRATPLQANVSYSWIVTMPICKLCYDYYSFKVIPAIGELVAGDKESYQYLVESIRRFPNQDTFARMIADTGFQKVEYENLVGGVVAIHSAVKW